MNRWTKGKVALAWTFGAAVFALALLGALVLWVGFIRWAAL